MLVLHGDHNDFVSISGAMAERTKLEAYIIFSFLNSFIFCLPAHWVWAKSGFLNILGMVDVAGAGPVHLVGGVTGLVATLMLKPRYGRYKYKHPPPMGSPTNALLGMFMLWFVACLPICKCCTNLLVQIDNSVVLH